MSKQVYISADYATDSGDRDVVDVLQTWGSDNYHKDREKAIARSTPSEEF